MDADSAVGGGSATVEDALVVAARAPVGSVDIVLQCMK
jgi:hypothetical protein